jgi:hypothetical protein
VRALFARCISPTPPLTYTSEIDQFFSTKLSRLLVFFLHFRGTHLPGFFYSAPSITSSNRDLVECAQKPHTSRVMLDSILGALSFPYHEPREGYWGDKTVTLNFCEEDYVISYYCAEFCNVSWPVPRCCSFSILSPANPCPCLSLPCRP